MSNAIKVTPEQLVSLGSVISRSAGEIAMQNNQLTNHITSVVGTEWISVASSRFQSLWQDWQTSASRLNEALSGISELLVAAGHEYGETERRLTVRFGGGS